MFIRFILGALALGLLVPTGAQAKNEQCTYGSDCLCDRLESDPNIIGCEDMEDPDLPNYGRRAGWAEKYSTGVSGCLYNPNPGSNTAYTRFGRGGNDCVDVVQEGNCDVSGQSDCVFQGRSALTHRAIPGRTGGILGSMRFERQRRFGVTMALKYSDNYIAPGDGANSGPAQKTNEWGEIKHPLLGASTGERNHPYGGTVLHMAPSGSTGNFDVLRGDAEISSSGKLRYTPDESKYKWGVTAGPGDWICVQQHWDGWGTSNATLRAWMDGQLVIHVRNINMTQMRDDGNGVGRMAWNNYYNGVVTEGGGRSGYPGPGIAGRYEDNVVVTKGSEPVSCAEIGFNGVEQEDVPEPPAPAPPPPAPEPPPSDGGGSGSGGGSGGGGGSPTGPPAAPVLLD